jgi:hypothetical protein
MRQLQLIKLAIRSPNYVWSSEQMNSAAVALCSSPSLVPPCRIIHLTGQRLHGTYFSTQRLQTARRRPPPCALATTGSLTCIRRRQPPCCVPDVGGPFGCVLDSGGFPSPCMPGGGLPYCRLLAWRRHPLQLCCSSFPAPVLVLMVVLYRERERQ